MKSAKKQYKIVVDYENDAEEFWENVGPELVGYPQEISEILEKDECDEIWVELTEERKADIDRWLETVPGWRSGPPHAETALLIFDEGPTEEISEEQALAVFTDYPEQHFDDLSFGRFEENFLVSGRHYKYGFWNTSGDYWYSFNTLNELREQIETEVTEWDTDTSN